VAGSSDIRNEIRRCVLCGKPREQVAKLILGLHGGVCVECVALCNDVIEQATGDTEPARTVDAGRTVTRQRLLYLHAATPSIRSAVIAMALHEPVPGSVTQIDSDPQEWPYGTVHDAILDGWQVIHFPNQRAPFDDREIDILGYEFILQKLEQYPV
jgi:hypothetical protein